MGSLSEMSTFILIAVFLLGRTPTTDGAFCVGPRLMLLPTGASNHPQQSSVLFSSSDDKKNDDDDSASSFMKDLQSRMPAAGFQSLHQQTARRGPRFDSAPPS